MASTIANEVTLKKVQAGTEAVYGTQVAPTFRLGGDLQITRDRPLVDNPVRDGTFNVPTSAKHGTATFSGTYADDLSYEDAAILMRYAVAPAPTPVNDGNTPAGYTWTYRPGQSMFQSFSAEHSVDGLKREATGLQFQEFTIAADIDNAAGNWTWNGPLFVKSDAMGTVTSFTATGGTTTTIVRTGAGLTVNALTGQFVKMIGGTAANIGEIRQIVSNTADTITVDMAFPAAVANTDTHEIMEAFTSLTSRTVDYIAVEGTQLFIANDVAGLATASNEVNDKLISWSITHQNSLRTKKFQDNVNSYSSKRGRGKRNITGVLTLEFDDWGEYKNWESSVPSMRALKIQQLSGPVIDTTPVTNKTAVITVPKLYWGSLNPNQDRNGNITIAMPFTVFLDTVAGYDIEYAFKNTLSALP